MQYKLQEGPNPISRQPDGLLTRLLEPWCCHSFLGMQGFALEVIGAVGSNLKI